MKLNIKEHFFSKEHGISVSQNLSFSESKKPLVMGILNLTPDSFFDGGSHNNINDILNSIGYNIVCKKIVIFAGCIDYCKTLNKTLDELFGEEQ